LGDALRFRGHSIPTGTLYRTGDTLTVRTWWSVDAPLERDYSIGLHLIDSKGNLVAQVDSGPTGRFTPDRTSLWMPGEVYRDDRQLRIPWCLLTGSYQVRLVVYGWWDGGRLAPGDSPSHKPDDSLLLEPITVASFAECHR